MYKQTVIQPYCGILLSSKKGRVTDICNNVDASQTHYTKCFKEVRRKI